jgi:hypothetical protein
VWLILVYIRYILSTFDKPTIDLVIPVNNAPLPTKALACLIPITSNLSV